MCKAVLFLEVAGLPGFSVQVEPGAAACDPRKVAVAVLMNLLCLWLYSWIYCALLDSGTNTTAGSALAVHLPLRCVFGDVSWPEQLGAETARQEGFSTLEMCCKMWLEVMYILRASGRSPDSKSLLLPSLSTAAPPRSPSGGSLSM